MLRLCALILAAFAATTLNWSAPVCAAPSTEQRLERITIRSVGSGPMAVVFIPGLASPSSVFEEAAAKLPKGDRHVFVQINGFAGSAPGKPPLENLIPEAVDELAGWLAKNKLYRSAVVGHSMGGLMALMLAKRHPDVAGRLLIVDSLPFYGMLFGPTATPEAVRPLVEQMRTALVSGTTPLTVPPHMSNNDSGKARILAWLKASDRKTVGEVLVEDATTDIRPDLPSIDVPVTILYAVPTPESKAMADALYGSAYKTLPNYEGHAIAGSEHFIMLDQPAQFEGQLRYFLR